MSEPEENPEEDSGRLKVSEFLSGLVSMNVGRFNQLCGFVAPAWAAWVVADMSLWWAVLVVVGAGVLMQVGLCDSFLNGYTAGHKDGFARGHVSGHECGNDRPNSTTLTMSEFLDWCESNSIPMEQAAQLIWKEQS